jgi:hypothetical protein
MRFTAIWDGVRFKIGAGIVKPAGLRIRLGSRGSPGGFAIRPAYYPPEIQLSHNMKRHLA